MYMPIKKGDHEVKGSIQPDKNKLFYSHVGRKLRILQ